jgi:multiple sugar transport system substrate-binding protein
MEPTEDQETQFETDNPGITIEFVAADQQNFYAMVAAGTPPDLYRTQAPIIPSFLARGLLYDLTPYFETSELIKIDDLADPNKYYWAENALTIGSGKIYGMCKDWSPDFTIFINTDIFAAAGVALPDDTKSLTYQEVKELAASLAKFEGDRVATWGYGYESGWTDRIWMNNLAELGENLYTSDFSKVVLTGNPNAVESANYYFTLAKENLSVSPVNPSPNGWAGGDFTAGILGIMQYGYWYSAMAETDITRQSDDACQPPPGLVSTAIRP